MLEVLTGVAVWLLIIAVSCLVARPIAPVVMRLRIDVRERRERMRYCKAYQRYEEQFWRPAIEDAEFRFETPPYAEEQLYDWRWRAAYDRSRASR